jgi:hypothetical protein
LYYDAQRQLIIIVHWVYVSATIHQYLNYSQIGEQLASQMQGCGTVRFVHLIQVSVESCHYIPQYLAIYLLHVLIVEAFCH